MMLLETELKYVSYLYKAEKESPSSSLYLRDHSVLLV